MAIVKTYVASDSSEFDFYGFFDRSPIFTSQKSTSYKILLDNSNTDYISVVGSGFKYDPSFGYPTAGTTTSAKSYDNGKLVGEISGLHITQAQAQAYIASNDPDAVARSIFKGADTVTGSKYVDFIDGFGGNDTLNGGLGSDVLQGGSGKDTFIFNTKPSGSNLDHITDFKSVDDTIKLENTGAGLFTKLAKGGLHEDEFAVIKSKSAVVDDDVHILYDKGHGILYYDPNGGTASGRVAFAVLDNHASLAFQDFSVI